MKFSLDDCEKFIKILEGLINSDWLQRELKKRGNLDPTLSDDKQIHPLALHLNLIREQIQICKKDRTLNVFEDIVRLAFLGMCLDYLKKRNVQGIDDKISDLKSSSYENYDKTVYEIRTAYSFSLLGHIVKFVKTDPPHSTHDLLLCDKFEVECKKKNNLTDRGVLSRNLYEEFQQKISSFMNEIGRNYLVSIQAFDFLDKSTLSIVLEKTKNFLKENREGIFSENEAVYTIKKINNKGELIKTKLKSSDLKNRQVNILVTEQQRIIKQICGIDIQNLMYNLDSYQPIEGEFLEIGNEVTFRNLKPILCNIPTKHRLNSVIESIKDTQKQFTGKKASLVCVELGDISRFWTQTDFDNLTKMIENFIQKDGHISGVLVTNARYFEENNKIVLEEQRFLFVNSKATFPLPDNFRIA